jgi:hypothetical protein
MINSYASVEQTFSRSNYARVKTFEINQRMEILNGLYGQLGFEYSDRIPITNIQLSRWSDELFQDLNDPIEFSRYTKLEVRLELLYRLGQKFYYRGDRKIAIPSSLPTLRFIYRQGIPEIANSEVRFNYLELEAWDDHHTARFGNTRWRASIGGFANTKNLRVLEYKFFRGSDRFFFSDPLRSLQLLGPTFNTPNAFVKAHAIHHFNGSILGKIPLINLTRVQLTGGAALLSIPQSDFHQVELYTGLERAIRIKDEIFRLGFYAVTADSNLGTANITFKLGVSFFNGFTQQWDY